MPVHRKVMYAVQKGECPIFFSSCMVYFRYLYEVHANVNKSDELNINLFCN